MEIWSDCNLRKSFRIPEHTLAWIWQIYFIYCSAKPNPNPYLSRLAAQLPGRLANLTRLKDYLKKNFYFVGRPPETESTWSIPYKSASMSRIGFKPSPVSIHFVLRNTLKGLQNIKVPYSFLYGFRSQQALFFKTMHAQALYNFLELCF